MRMRAFLAALLLSATPALAQTTVVGTGGMQTSGANATAAALQALATKAGSASLTLNGGDSAFSQFSMKYNGTLPLMQSVTDASGNYLYRLYPNNITLDAYSADTYTQGPPIVVGFLNATPANGDTLGHYAWQGWGSTGSTSDNQVETFAYVSANATTVLNTGMYSQMKFGVMRNVAASPPTVEQPNDFMIWDGSSGLTVPANITDTNGVLDIQAPPTTGNIVAARLENNPNTSATDAVELALRVDGTDKFNITAGRDGGNTYGLTNINDLLAGTMTTWMAIGSADGTHFSSTLSGQLFLPGLTSGSGTSALCLNATGKQIETDTNTTVCGFSAAYTKDITGEVTTARADAGLTRLAALDRARLGSAGVPVWHFKSKKYGDPKVTHVGLVADDVAAMDPRCGIYEHGKLKNYEDRCVLAYLTATVAAQQAEIADLKREIARR